MLINRYRLAKADAVLAELSAIDARGDFYLEAYSNCREQGYHLHNFKNNRHVSFSENRSSDQIVVYAGEGATAFSSNNVPEEASYKNKQYFDHNRYDEAAQWIVNYLCSKEVI